MILWDFKAPDEMFPKPNNLLSVAIKITGHGIYLAFISRNFANEKP